MNVRMSVAAGLLFSLAGAAAVEAKPLEFTVTGGLFGTDPATFTLSSTPTPSRYNPVGFGINDVPVSHDGADVDYNLGFGGSFFPFFEYATSGSADFGAGLVSLFTGPISAPTFKVGDYTFLDAETDTALTVDVSAAPEPSTWLLMIGGISGIGLMLRRSKQTMGFRFKDAFSA